jgi:hypothetical protein
MGLTILIGVLIIIAIILIFAMNWNNYQGDLYDDSHKEEGFSDESSAVERQIRKVLDDLTVEEICPIFVTIRTNMKKNEMSGPTPATSAEADRKVEANLALKIPGGALPCPLLSYPRPGSSDLDWLDFVQKIPIDYGARIVFMAIFAQEYLGSTEKILKDALGGKGKVPPVEGAEGKEGAEGFIVCSPDVIDSRKAEKLKKGSTNQACDMPENLTPAQISESVTLVLKQLVSEKTTFLTKKKIDPQIDILPLIKDATKSAEYLNQKGKEAEEGSLQMTDPIQITEPKEIT